MTGSNKGQLSTQVKVLTQSNDQSDKLYEMASPQIKAFDEDLAQDDKDSLKTLSDDNLQIELK